MKHILTILALFIFAPGFAQKVDLDRYYFSASYRDLPRLGIDTSCKTFMVRADMGENAAYMLRNEQPEDRINITGWRRVRNHGDLLVSVQMDDINIVNSDVKEREEILKDKTGRETGRKYYYHVELQYTFNAKMRLADKHGAPIIEHSLCTRQTPRFYSTKEYSSSAEALTMFVSNVVAVTSAVTSLEVNQAMNSVNAELNAAIGFNPRTVGDYLWILDSKKHHEYQAHRRAWAAFRQAMFQMRADKPLNEVAAMLKPVIDYFNSMKTKYPTGSKADRKMRYASYYNLAKIYYYLDDPDASLYEAGQLMINDYDERDGRGLEAAASGLKQSFELNHIHTRHFPVDNDVIPGAQAYAGY